MRTVAAAVGVKAAVVMVEVVEEKRAALGGEEVEGEGEEVRPRWRRWKAM